MSKYLAGRLLQTVPTVFLVTVAVFLMLHLTPGDPAEVFLGDKRSSPELLEKVREDMGLNRPLHVQYLSYMGNALRGDLGRSLQTNVPVMEQILNRLPWTIELAAAALMIAAFIGISVGIIAALNHNTIADTLAMALALVGISMPVYWSSLLLILLFALLGTVSAIVQGGIVRRLVPRTGELKLLRASAVPFAAGLALIGLASETSLLLTGLVLLGIGYGGAIPSVLGLLSRAVEPERQGAVLGVGQSVGSLARVIGPSMAGYLFDARLFLPYLAGAALIAVGTAISAGLRQPRAPDR